MNIKNSIAKSSERKITARDRGVPITSIGVIDADVCSSSSPGLGGLVSPFAKTYGLHFTDEMEPQDDAFEMIYESRKYADKSTANIDIPDTYEEYVKMKERWANDMNNFLRINRKEEEPVYVQIGDRFDDEMCTFIFK